MYGAETDQAKFEGNGVSYRAKVIGIEDVAEARGDEMCQETILKLKEQVKASGQHKQRIFVNVTLEGLRIVEASNLTVLHTHPVHQISFISRDVTDSRAFGYIYSAGDGTHKFFGIKTANAAENLVVSLRDLFQTVYEMKKKEIDEAKAKAASGTEGEGDAEKTDPATDQSGENQESIYQVPKSNAPVNPQEQNLFDLEDQAETILKGIEQIKNLDFDELTMQDAPRQSATSPTSPGATDPWGMSTPGAGTAATSQMSNLQQLSTPPVNPGPFGGMQAFPTSPVGMNVAPGFGMGQPGAMPFGMPGQQGAQMMGGAPLGAAYGQQPGFGAPFGGPMRSPLPGQAFPAMAAPGAPGMQPGFAGTAPGFNPFGMRVPPAGMAPQMMSPGPQAGGAGADPFQNPPANMLQPMRPGGGEEQGKPGGPKSPTRAALFGDLVDIKKSASADSTVKSPKEMFKDLTQPPKKSLNEIKGGGTSSQNPS